MNNVELEKYLKKYIYNFSFLENIDELRNIISLDDKKHDEKYYEDSKKKIKDFVKKEVHREYLEDRNKLFNNFINKIVKSNDLDEYGKMSMLNNILGITNDLKPTVSFYRELINGHQSLKKMLDILYLEEDKSGTVNEELKAKYPKSEAFLDTYREYCFVLDPNKQFLTMEETKKLFKIIRDENSTEEEIKAAKDELVLRNVGLAQKIAHQYSFNKGVVTQFEDLYHDGIEGFYKAIDRFNPDKGIRFTTYAVYWIRQSIKRSRDNNSRTIRVPVHRIERMENVTYRMSNYIKEHGSLSDEEIIERLGITREEYEEFKLISGGIVSLDQTLLNTDEDSETTLSHYLASDDNVEQTATNRVDEELLKELIKKELNPREQFILFNRFGFDGVDSLSVTDIAKQLHVSKQRVNQIEFRAFAKIARIYQAMEKYDIVNEENLKDYEKDIRDAKRRNSMRKI